VIEETSERAFLVEGMIHREFRADLSVGDGRTVDVRIVPYGERISHSDGTHGGGRSYQEEFMPGVFNHQLNAPFRVHANIEHDQSSIAKAGHGIALREGADGFYGTFRLLKNQAGETARELIEAGALDGVSLEAREKKTIRGKDGVLRRAKADLRAIAFTRFGAYQGAKVLALREEDEQIIDEEQQAYMPVDIDPEVIERCRRLGMKLPQRYEAHPEPGTPDESGTPDTGTRPSTENTNEQE